MFTHCTNFIYKWTGTITKLFDNFIFQFEYFLSNKDTINCFFQLHLTRQNLMTDTQLPFAVQLYQWITFCTIFSAESKRDVFSINTQLYIKGKREKTNKFITLTLADAYYRNVPYSVITGNRYKVIPLQECVINVTAGKVEFFVFFNMVSYRIDDGKLMGHHEARHQLKYRLPATHIKQQHLIQRRKQYRNVVIIHFLITSLLKLNLRVATKKNKMTELYKK